MKTFGFALGLCVLVGTLQATAATISSDSFTFGIGATSMGNPVWSGTENEATNSSTTNGDFTYAPSGSSSYFSGTGPAFGGMTLTTGGSGLVSGDSVDFVLNIAGSYFGTPADAAAIPNYKINVEITRLGIYAMAWTGASTNVFQFNETTAGHTASSTPVALTAYNNGAWANAESYSLVSWDPAEYEVDGTSFMRTFTLPATDFAIDGLVIEGKVNVTYDAVPEPATMGLLTLGGLLMARKKS